MLFFVYNLFIIPRDPLNLNSLSEYDIVINHYPSVDSLLQFSIGPVNGKSKPLSADGSIVNCCNN